MLYECHLELHIDGYGLSAAVTERFGIRTIESVIHPETKGHMFIVNGCKASTLSIT